MTYFHSQLSSILWTFNTFHIYCRIFNSLSTRKVIIWYTAFLQDVCLVGTVEDKKMYIMIRWKTLQNNIQILLNDYMWKTPRSKHEGLLEEGRWLELEWGPEKWPSIRNAEERREGRTYWKLEKNENVHLAITGPIILKFYIENVGKEIDLKDSLVSRGK